MAEVVRLLLVDDDFILLISHTRAHASGRSGRVRPRWRTLTSISGTTGNPQGPLSAAATAPRAIVRSVLFLRARITYPSSLALGVARLRSYALVRHPGGSQRNIWPGRPDVSYWRNMARSREIFLLEALASGDVYLNNYSPPPSYGAYATADFPPVAIFRSPSHRSSAVIPYVIFVPSSSFPPSAPRDSSRSENEAAGAVTRGKIKIPSEERAVADHPPKGTLSLAIFARLFLRRIATTRYINSRCLSQCKEPGGTTVSSFKSRCCSEVFSQFMSKVEEF